MATNIGNTGEQIFYHRARRFHKVEWVADDKNYWGKDIDFIVTNPRTGETMTIAASKSPKFKAGKALKDSLN